MKQTLLLFSAIMISSAFTSMARANFCAGATNAGNSEMTFALTGETPELYRDRIGKVLQFVKEFPSVIEAAIDDRSLTDLDIAQSEVSAATDLSNKKQYLVLIPIGLKRNTVIIVDPLTGSAVKASTLAWENAFLELSDGRRLRFYGDDEEGSSVFWAGHKMDFLKFYRQAVRDDHTNTVPQGQLSQKEFGRDYRSAIQDLLMRQVISVESLRKSKIYQAAVVGPTAKRLNLSVDAEKSGLAAISTKVLSWLKFLLPSDSRLQQRADVVVLLSEQSDSKSSPINFLESPGILIFDAVTKKLVSFGHFSKSDRIFLSDLRILRYESWDEGIDHGFRWDVPLEAVRNLVNALQQELIP